MKFKATLKIAVSLIISMYWKACMASNKIAVSVDPPTNLQILDPGYLGHLHITWQPPASLENVKNCSVRFQLQYFSTSEGRWVTIRTKNFNYSAQFDLGKEVQVKIQTLLRGQCSNGTDVLSLPAEKTVLPSRNGSSESKIKDFRCIFYYREYMECTWVKGNEVQPQSEYFLFYWHNGMDQAMECPKYIKSNGFNVGCNFSSKELVEFAEFNICVNGSSAKSPMRAAYFTLKPQNLVKPAALEILNLTATDNEKILLEWTPPTGKIPKHCLEYEVQYGREDREWMNHIIKETTFAIVSIDQSEKHCFRLRSRMNMFCADSEVWSDWSNIQCFPGVMKEKDTASEAVLFSVLAATTIVLFTVFLCLLIRKRMFKPKGIKDISLLGVESSQN
uniref:Interleukin 13 receptor, alpha 2 n=1 Tax=Lepisosteus oculatus TaxID=7918 RepID=W5N846_LEPOC|nr:PREDICTED: interleukin-13 receptor subunit alpha-2 [Lepisosteus oculatus]